MSATRISPPQAFRPLRVDGGFRNPGHHRDRGWHEVLAWKLTSRPARWPALVAPPPSPPPPAPSSGCALTWIGHASFLLQTPGLTALIDPVWSERAGPFGLLGPKRALPPGVAFAALPVPDVVLLTHDHYDHCDLPTLRRLARTHPQCRLHAPLGFDRLAQRAGFGPDRTHLHDWWQGADGPGGYRLTLTPARHWGNRLSGRRNARLWGGWHLSGPPASIQFVGDTARDDALFSTIRHVLGSPDLAALPIGAYAPRWFMREQHCDPDEAVAIHQQLGSRLSVGCHWGTFRLTDEPRNEPPTRLAAALAAAGLPASDFITLAPGATISTASRKG